MPSIREIPRSKLFEVLKTEELVRYIEQIRDAAGNAQPTADNLAAIAALTFAADKLIYTTGPAAAALTSFPLFGRLLVAAVNAPTARGTLGLAAIAASGSLDDLGGLGANVSAFLATPSSANLRTALTDETGSGAAVFGAHPTISDPEFTGTRYFQQGAPASYAASATLTAADLLGGLVQYTGAAANLTLPTGSNLDTAVVSGLGIDRAFDLSIINTGSGAATVLTNTGWTIVGAAGVASADSGQFRARKTASGTYTLYRLA